MDPLSITGLVVGIVGLYSTCRDCYIFFSDVQSAEKDAFILIRELGIQESILKSWGFYWEIQRHDAALGKHAKIIHEKLQCYLAKNFYKAEGVADTLYAIADSLSNREKLLKRYGLDLKPRKGGGADTMPTAIDADTDLLAVQNINIESVQTASNKVRTRMPLLQRCRWALKDREKFKNLISNLKSYNDSLYLLCPDGAFEAMYLQLTSEYLAHHDSRLSLRVTSRLAYGHLKGEESSPSQHGLRMLADVAAIKGKIANLSYDGQGELHPKRRS